MKQYLKALKICFENGIDIHSRAGYVRKSFGYQMRFNLQDGFPAVTTKKLAWKSVISELLWFLEGSNDERRLAEILYEKDRKDLRDKKTIWTQNANCVGSSFVRALRVHVFCSCAQTFSCEDVIMTTVH